MKILPYTKGNLAFALQNNHTTIAQASSKNHFRYFFIGIIIGEFFCDETHRVESSEAVIRLAAT